MMEGMIVATEGAMALRDVLAEIATKMKIDMPSSFEEFGNMWEEMDMADKAKFLGQAFGAIAGQIGALNNAMQAKSQQVVAGIDKEIAAEKKRDGASSASSAKIKALEAKKEKEKKKAFETDKKMKIAQTVMATAMGIMQAFQMGPILGPIFGAMVAATGAMQLSVIKGMTYEGGGGGGSAGGISAMSVGQKSNSVDLAKGNNQSGELASARGAQGTGQMQNFTPAFTGYKNRAAGGNTGFIVGEQGPELFIPEIPGNIIPAGETAAGSPPTNVSFTIQAIDASGVEDMLDAQKGNIIRMIREAANQQGEFFLEAVEETNL
jgi:hypothetical protein